MFFISMIHTPTELDIYDKHYFCIDIDQPLFEHIQKQYYWFIQNNNVDLCEFSMDNYRARYVEDAGDIYDYTFNVSEDPLYYYEYVLGDAKTNDLYWSEDYNNDWCIPKKVNFVISGRYIWFKFWHSVIYSEDYHVTYGFTM